MSTIRMDDPKTGDTVDVITFEMPRGHVEGVGEVSFCVWECWHTSRTDIPLQRRSRLWGPTDAFGLHQTLELAVGSRRRRGWVRTVIEAD